MADIETLEQIKVLRNHVGFKALQTLADEERTGYYAELARRLAGSNDTVDQRSLDYKRGFFRGMFWILNYVDSSNFDVELKKALEERTTSE